jgi:hypothetical protein
LAHGLAHGLAPADDVTQRYLMFSQIFSDRFTNSKNRKQKISNPTQEELSKMVVYKSSYKFSKF